MQLPYSEELNIEYLGQLFRNTTECYKFFWFKAIVKKVTKGKLELTYEELVDEMIADAWYMVTEYHLNLGPKDTLESLVTLIKQKNPELKSKEEKTLIIDFLKNTEDKELISKKRALTYNVPYRLQSPFLENLKGKDWNVGETKLIEKINQENRLIYYFTALNGLATKIIIQKDWAEYIVKNQQIIWGWLEYNMILYIQKRNPNVPGIADKLYPPKERKLEKIKNYWKLILSLEPIREIYGDEILTEQNISIDHFVPWSYVLVVYCAKHPAHKFTTVVGWYKHATVFRHYQEAVFAPEDIQYYNAIANSSDCVLLPAGIRSRKVQWEVPRKSNGWAYGFGRANVWYASEEDSRLQDYLTRLVKQIDEYDGENWIDKYAE